MTKLTIISLVALIFLKHGNAKAESFAETLKQVDHDFFERSFNMCDMEYHDKHVSEDLIFYHDQSGFQDFEKFNDNIRKYICSGIGPKPIRRLFPGSLNSHPLYENGKLYGAVQSGRHAFYIKHQDGTEELTSTADFTNTWTLENGKWLLSNVLSYNHESPSADEKEIENVLSDSKVPALAIGLIKNGEVTDVNVYGKLHSSAPAPLNSLFKVASLTKPIVTMLTLKLIQAGELSFDEKLYKYWIDPDIRDEVYLKELSIYHVLTHQTGFMNWRWMSEDKQLSFLYRPGEGYGYSGEGFEYLRKSLEAKFETSIEELAKKYVFRPAGMTDTHFWWDDNVDIERYALNHDDKGETYSLNKYFEANAAANLITTISDYTRFLSYVLNQQHIMPNIYKRMISKNVELGEEHYFGIGWEIFDRFSNGDKAIMHTGKDPGVNTLAVFFPSSKNGYVILMNGDNAVPVLNQVLPNLYLGDELWNRR